MGARGQAADGRAVRVDVRDVACRRGGQILFAGLTLTLAPGQAALIAGPNGVGKSSLLRMLCGLLPVYAGTVVLEGGIALADDRLALDGDRPLEAALSFWARLDGMKDSVVSASMTALELGFLQNIPVRMLSTGQRKRAVLARVIGSGAGIWLLDEPGNGLDTTSLRLLGEAVERHRAQGGIVVAASHQPLPWAADASLTLARPSETAP